VLGAILPAQDAQFSQKIAQNSPRPKLFVLKLAVILEEFLWHKGLI
jgi:hypothetical protein